jgi:hypothetical protein
VPWADSAREKNELERPLGGALLHKLVTILEGRSLAHSAGYWPGGELRPEVVQLILAVLVLLCGRAHEGGDCDGGRGDGSGGTRPPLVRQLVADLLAVQTLPSAGLSALAGRISAA